MVSWGLGCGSSVPGVYADVQRQKKAILVIGHEKDFVYLHGICLFGISSSAFRLSSWIESEITRENLRRGTKSG